MPSSSPPFKSSHHHYRMVGTAHLYISTPTIIECDHRPSIIVWHHHCRRVGTAHHLIRLPNPPNSSSSWSFISNPLLNNIFPFSPTHRINPFLDKTMKRRIGPISDIFCQPMLDRIIMNIIEMPVVILLSTDQMFPKPSLPNCAFPVFLSGIGF